MSARPRRASCRCSGRPSETLSFYFDSLYSEADHAYERNDLNLAVRSTNTNVPVNVELDENNVVTSATIANPQWLNENRPYHEDTDFINLNTGMEWKIGEKFTLDASLNYNHSDWFRSTNTYLFNSESQLRHHRRPRGQRRRRDQGHAEPRPERSRTSGTGTRCASSRCSVSCGRRAAHFEGEWAFADAFKVKAG